jgi:hypothetical protein
MIQRGSDISRSLDRFPSIRTAYSYIKRWVAIRGLAQGLPDNQIFKILQEYQKSNSKLITASNAGHPSSSALIHQFFKQDAYKIDASLSSFRSSEYQSYDTNGWESMLWELDSLPLEKKFHCEHPIRVMVTYSGVSQMKGAQWLLVVQRKLVKLKERK